MKKILIPVLASAVFFAGCKKSDSTEPAQDFNTTETNAINDFVNKVAIPGYAELQVKGNTFNTAIINLNTSSTEANLSAAKDAWKDMRSTWEKCEGYLFGPVEDNEYDPDTDTWPVNFNDLDALLASNQPLSLTDIEALTSRALKGYHPIEYILWGQGGNRAAASLTARQKEYMVSLAAHLKLEADNLYASWDPASGNYAHVVLTAGAGSASFVKKQDLFLAITDGLVGICGEVGDGKMKEPYNSQDPQTVESPFSGNSTIDFKNNITGAYNVYLGKFNADGAGMEDLVKAKNSALDIEIQQKFNAAIGSFSAITVPYEQAIISQRTQCLASMTAINDLSNTIDVKLRAFVYQYIIN